MFSPILFWAVALGLVAAALAFILPGFLKEGARRRTAAMILAVLLPAAAAALYFAFGTPQAVNSASELSADLAPTNAADYVSRLETHLARQPRDACGWVPRGRTSRLPALNPLSGRSNRRSRCRRTGRRRIRRAVRVR
jgi:predicted PurR-regulated permease PerM